MCWYGWEGKERSTRDGRLFVGRPAAMQADLLAITSQVLFARECVAYSGLYTGVACITEQGMYTGVATCIFVGVHCRSNVYKSTFKASRQGSIGSSQGHRFRSL